MNDQLPEAGADAEAPLREPLTIADAARRAGVHPNTVRRLIRQGRVAARMVRGRYGDTWLVEAADIDGAVGAQIPAASGRVVAGNGSPREVSSAGQAPETSKSVWTGAIESPDFLPSGTDLSLDRARALERYTHGLLQPLVELLREREAAIEGRDTLIRTQAERIGRLERELELVREARASATAAAAATTRAPSPWPVSAAAASASPPPDDDLPEHVSALAGQVGRLRAELQLIATALRPEEEAPLPEPLRAPVPLPPEPDLDTGAAPALVSPPAPAVTPEEMASLFPSASRGRLTLRPLEGDGPVGDPFANAEAAVEELRRALAPNGAASAAESPIAAESTNTGSSPPNAVPPIAAPARAQAEPPAQARRWWWPW